MFARDAPRPWAGDIGGIHASPDRLRRCHRVLALAFVAPSFAQAPEKPKLTIGVGGKTLFYYLPLTIAERKGYFKDEGLDVEILDFPGGAQALQALLGGSVDVVSGAYEHTITQQAKGQNIEALVLQGKYAGIVLGDEQGEGRGSTSRRRT